MLPPVLEIYIVWHPSDRAGEAVALEFFRHFHGSRYTGLMADAVEVFLRSHGWLGDNGPPRPIYTPATPPPRGLSQAQLTVIVPIVDMELARAARLHDKPWARYMTDLVRDCDDSPNRCTIIPVILDPNAMRGVLGTIIGRFHRLDGTGRNAHPNELDADRRCRELAQAIVRFAGGPADDGRLKVFISHTNRTTTSDGGTVEELINTVASVIDCTHLDKFFAPTDLQPGQDWHKQLIDNAASGALLALRTDQYASREWCQREMLIAKQHGMPVIILDPIGGVEERGSFLMDNVPRVPVLRGKDGWNREDILRGLNLLVDECLRYKLWRHQQELAKQDETLKVWWWAPHLPEPATLIHRLMTNGAKPAQPVRILHPEPLLGPDEVDVLEQVGTLGGIVPSPEFLTPQQLAARDGIEPGAGDVLPEDSLAERCVGLSVSGSEDLARLGLIEDHFRLAVAEIARAVVRGGGRLIYGGYLRQNSYTRFLNEQMQRDLSAQTLTTPPLHICLAWQEHREMALDDLEQADRLLGLFGEITYLDINGREVDQNAGRGRSPEQVSQQDRWRALTSMRNYMADHQHARVFIGGAQTSFQGRVPGLIEEAHIALSRDQPIYLAGGFGGATMDIVRALGIDDGSWAPGIAGARPPGYDVIEQYPRRPAWHGLRNNGLTDDEIRWLAISHRPSDIAALVASGLGRLSQGHADSPDLSRRPQG